MKIVIDGKLVEVGGGATFDGLPLKTVTKEEYDALPEEQKQSETAWLVTDAEGGGGSSSSGGNGEVYSEEEVRIGTWIDGKPLYRKTFCTEVVTSQNSSQDTTILEDEAIDLLVDYTAIGRCVKDNYDFIIPYAVPYSGSTMQYAQIFHDTALHAIRLMYDWHQVANLTIYSTIRYTKTTD